MIQKKILKLAKILGRFTLEKASLILELPETEIEKNLKELEALSLMKKIRDEYIYQPQNIKIFDADIVNLTESNTKGEKQVFRKIMINKELEKEYDKLPDFKKSIFDKYLNVLNAAGSIEGKAINKFLENWNRENPQRKVSYNSFITAKRKYLLKGIKGIFPKHKTDEEKKAIIDAFYPFFKKHYLEYKTETAAQAKKEALLEFRKSGLPYCDKLVPNFTLFMKMLKDEYGERKILKIRNPERYKKLIQRKNNCIRSDLLLQPKEFTVPKSTLFFELLEAVHSGKIRNLFYNSDKKIYFNNYYISLKNALHRESLKNYYLFIDILIVLMYFYTINATTKVNVDDLLLCFEKATGFNQKRKSGYHNQYRRQYRSYLDILSKIIVKSKNKKAKSLVKITWDNPNKDKSMGYFTFKIHDSLLSGDVMKISQAYLSYNLKNNISEKLFGSYLLQQKQNNVSLLKIKASEVIKMITTTGKLRFTKATTVNRLEWLLDKLKDEGLIHVWAYREIYNISEMKQNAGWINRWLDYHVLIDISENGINAEEIVSKTTQCVKDNNMLVKDFADKANFSKMTATKILNSESIDNTKTVIKLADFLERECCG